VPGFDGNFELRVFDNAITSALPGRNSYFKMLMINLRKKRQLFALYILESGIARRNYFSASKTLNAMEIFQLAVPQANQTSHCIASCSYKFLLNNLTWFERADGSFTPIQMRVLEFTDRISSMKLPLMIFIS